MKFKTLMAIALLAFGGSVMAQGVAPKDPAATPGLDKRQANQEKRIDQGVASGQLTAKETNNLNKREAKLAANEAAAKADGTVTKAERRKLKAQAKHDSKVIHKKKHNDKTAPPAGQ
jgi:hypothetical protein